MDIKEKIRGLSRDNYKEFVSIRRHIHAHPELSFQETETAEFISGILDKWGIGYKKGIAGTGMVARIQSGQGGKVIALRTELDALPVNEMNKVPYKSVYPGKMHACGHDVHMSCVLGAMHILKELKGEWTGTVKFIFQPGEELIPGGAGLMLKENALEPDEPEIVIAQHVFPDLETGHVGFREGKYMASSDEIYITVIGKGGHAALPDRLVDPVLIAAHLLTSLQQVVSRNTKPGLPAVLSFGKVDAPGAVNVIPDYVKLEGTFRTMDEDWREEAHELIKKITYNLVSSMGGEAKIEIRKGYPVLSNDPAVTRRARSFAVDYLGEDKVHDLDIRMTAEDFAYFARKYPSVMFRLGTAGKAMLHSPVFNVDEIAIQHSTGLLAYMAIQFLNNE